MVFDNFELNIWGTVFTHISLVYYWSEQVIIPLHKLKAINPSSSRTNASEKYLQVISIDNHEFWFMGFLNYTGAVDCLQEALQARNLQSVWVSVVGLNLRWEGAIHDTERWISLKFHPIAVEDSEDKLLERNKKYLSA